MQKLLKIFLLAFFSLVLTSEDLLETSMTEEDYANFKVNLIKSIKNHPEALLQNSLVSQKVYDVEIVKSRLKPQLYFLSSSKSPLDSETDSDSNSNNYPDLVNESIINLIDNNFDDDLLGYNDFI